jgi:hypothetical protein
VQHLLCNLVHLININNALLCCWHIKFSCLCSKDNKEQQEHEDNTDLAVMEFQKNLCLVYEMLTEIWEQ